MRIAFIISGLNKGGAERVASSLANYFSELGEEVYIIKLDTNKPAYELNDGVKVINLVQGISHSGVGNIFNHVRQIRQLNLKIGFGCILAFSCRHAVIAKAAVGKKSKVVGTERSNPFVARKRIIDKVFVKLSVILDGFIFQTNGAKSFYPINIQNKSVVIPNGVSAKMGSNMEPFDKRDNVICATGNLRKVKRYDLIIDAFYQINKDFEEYKLNIYGDGEMKEELKELVKKYNIIEKVIFHGVIDNIEEELKRSKIYILASDHEGMPNGLLEAMACGCVCVSTDCDFGPSEIIVNGKNGLLVPTDSSQILANTIRRVLNDASLAEVLSTHAKQISNTNSIEKISRKYYDYILNGDIKDESIQIN